MIISPDINFTHIRFDRYSGVSYNIVLDTVRGDNAFERTVFNGTKQQCEGVSRFLMENINVLNLLLEE